MVYVKFLELIFNLIYFLTKRVDNCIHYFFTQLSKLVLDTSPPEEMAEGEV